MVLIRWIWLSELIVASTRYLPNIVIATTCILSGRGPRYRRGPSRSAPSAKRRPGSAPGQAGGLDEAGRIEPEIELVQLREIRRNRYGLSVAIDVATPCRRSRHGSVAFPSESACPPSQPTPYFHAAGLMPGSRSKVSMLVRVSQSMLRV